MSSSSAIRLDKVGILAGTSLEDSKNSSTTGVHLKDHGTHRQDGVDGLEVHRRIAWVQIRTGANGVANLTEVETSDFKCQVFSFGVSQTKVTRTLFTLFLC
jgi:hypothetical protein